jgi:hypothetical protein
MMWWLGIETHNLLSDTRTTDCPCIKEEFGSLFNLLVRGKNLTFGEELQTLGLESFQVWGTSRFVNLVSSRKEGLVLKPGAILFHMSGCPPHPQPVHQESWEFRGQLAAEELVRQHHFHQPQKPWWVLQ